MPIFTSLLFLFLALALLPLAFRGNRARQTRREESALAERMALGASICIAAAREAFGVELDRSLDSLAAMDSLIADGWAPSSPTNSAQGSELDSTGVTFVLAAYLGTAFALHRAAEWRIENGKPALYFRTVNESEYPLELIELKLREPVHVNLSKETERWGLPPEPATASENDRPAE